MSNRKCETCGNSFSEDGDSLLPDQCPECGSLETEIEVSHERPEALGRLPPCAGGEA